MNHIVDFELYCVNESNRVDYLKSMFADNLDLLEQVLEVDPTDKKIYSQWLMGLVLGTKKMLKNNIAKLKVEDLYKATEYLSIFDRPTVRKHLERKDINLYTSLTDLASVVTQFRDNDTILSNNEIKNKNKIGESKDFFIYSPKTYEDSMILGKGTEWCTATGKTRKYYDKYSEMGRLFILVSKKDDKEKYQFNFESGQFMDKMDVPIDSDEFRTTYPETIMRLRELYNNDDLFGIYGQYLSGSREEEQNKVYNYTGDLEITNSTYILLPTINVDGNVIFKENGYVQIEGTLNVTGNIIFDETDSVCVKGNITTGRNLQVKKCGEVQFYDSCNLVVKGELDIARAKSKGLAGKALIHGDFWLEDSYVEDCELPLLRTWKIKGKIY